MNRLVKIRIWDPTKDIAERVWAENLGDGKYRLGNEPMHPDFHMDQIVDGIDDEATGLRVKI